MGPHQDQQVKLRVSLCQEDKEAHGLPYCLCGLSPLLWGTELSVLLAGGVAGPRLLGPLLGHYGIVNTVIRVCTPPPGLGGISRCCLSTYLAFTLVGNTFVQSPGVSERGMQGKTGDGGGHWVHEAPLSCPGVMPASRGEGRDSHSQVSRAYTSSQNLLFTGFSVQSLLAVPGAKFAVGSEPMVE